MKKLIIVSNFESNKKYFLIKSNYQTNLFKSISPFFVHIRFKYNNPNIARWFRAIFIYLEQLCSILDISLPSSHYYYKLQKTAMNYIQSVTNFLVWIFGTDSYMFDQIIILVVHILFLIYIIMCAKIYQQKKFVSYWPVFTIFIYLYYYTPIFIFGFFFRISDTIENLISNSSTNLWISFCVEIINYFFFIFFIYLDSLFLEPFAFVSTCNLDIYDSKGTMILFFAQTYMCICANLINLLTAKYIDLIFVTIGLGFAFLVIFYRFLLVKHVSAIGDYLEISNIVSFPFVLLVHRFVPGGDWIIFYFDLGFHIFTIICIAAVKYLKIRRAKKISIILLQNTDNNNLPQVVSDSFVSTIRVLVRTNGNPAVFERLLQHYQQAGLKSSIVLEIVRFLSVFPEKRNNMILLLRTLNSKTNYNLFMTYLFHKTLVSLIRNSTEDNLHYFTDLKRQFLVHQSLFWIRRSQKLYFKALKEAFSVAYYYIELKSEIYALMNRFPYDNSIYIQYGEFLLFACGDFDLHLRCNEIASELKIHKLAIEDPLLHPMLNFSPRIMQFCKVNKRINNNDNTTFDTTAAATTTVNNNNNTNNNLNLNLHANGSSSAILDTRLSNIRKNESGTDDSFLSSIKVSSLITPSKRNIPFWPLYNIILVFMFFFVFFGFEINFENKTKTESDSISSKLTQDVDLITEITANSIITIATNHYLMDNFTFYRSDGAYFRSNSLSDDIDFHKEKINSRKKFFFNNNSDFIYVNNDKIYTEKYINELKSAFNSTSNISAIKDIFKYKINSKNSISEDENEEKDCYDNIKQIVTTSYELLDDWTQISYASKILSDALYKFFYYAIYSPVETCDIIDSITNYIENVTITEFEDIENSIQRINDQIINLDHHIKYRYNATIFFVISILYSIIFILIYIFIIVMQVNSVFKEDDIAIKFLSSKERLSMMISEQTEDSWQLLLQHVNENTALQNIKIDSNTTIGIHLHKSFNDFESNTANTTRNNTRTNTPNNTVNNTANNTTNITTNNATNNTTNNSTNNNNNTNTSNSNSKVMGSSSLIINRSELKISLKDEKPSQLSLSPINSPSTSLESLNGPAPMMLPRMGRTSVTFTGYPTQLFKSSNDMICGNRNFKHNRIALSEGQSETDYDERNDHHQGSKNSRESLPIKYGRRATSTDGSFSQNETISEVNTIDGIIHSTLKKSKLKWLNVAFLLFSCWFVLILTMLLFIFPLHLRSNRQTDISSTMLNLGNQIEAFFRITGLVYYSIIHSKNLSYDEIEIIQQYVARYHDEITSPHTVLTDLYTREQCLMLQGVTCTSAARIVFRFMRDPSFSTTDDDIESAVHLYMPACLFFSRQLLTDLLYNDLIELTERKYSVDYCFLVLSVLFFFVCFHISYVIQKLLNEGFNSLFHYPESLRKKNINEKDDTKKNKKLKKIKNSKNIFKFTEKIDDDFYQSIDNFPSSILVLSYVSETDEIYSISDNSQSILQRQPQEFISRKFSQTFPLVSNSKSESIFSSHSENHEEEQQTIEIREHLMPDKKSKKTFRTSSTKMNQIVKIVMIEETKQNSVLFIPLGSKPQQNENQGLNATAVSSAPSMPANPQKTESMVNKLTFFLPSSFAKSFNDENVSAVNYTKCIVIMIRIKNNITFQATEKFFSILNSQVSNYSSINIMKIDGAVVTLSTVSETQPIIPFLFIRDILNDSKNFSKTKPELFAPECFLLTNSQYASGEIKEGIEPFLEFDMPNYGEIEKTLFSLENDSCFFSDELLIDFPSFEKMCNEYNSKFEDLHISSISFPKYLSYFTNYI